jgi:hypothetical protein
MRDRLTVSIILLLFMVPIGTFAAGFGQPSNPAGIWEMDLTEGTHLISFPVLAANATVSSVLTDQFPGGMDWEEATRIVSTQGDSITGSFYSSVENEWVGDLVDLHADQAYWIILPEFAPDVELRLIGAALPMVETVVTSLSPGLNYVACPAVVPVTLAGSGLITSGCVGAQFSAKADRVYTWSDELLVPAWNHPVEGWIGAEFTLHPGKGYIVERASGESDLEWVRPELIVGVEPPRGGEEPTITPAIAPMTQSFSIDFETPPWESRSSSAGGQR